jgi:4-alpha-glucanotransferase
VGQNWGIPLYDWAAMRATNFEWWRQRVRGVRRIFHVFRIDHVLGFYRIYAFPWRPQRNAEFLPLSQHEMLERTGGRAPHFAPRDDESWENCEANRREGEEYLRMALEAAETTRLVGEDLGTVPPYVRPSLQSLGIAGFKSRSGKTRPMVVSSAATNTSGCQVTDLRTHDHKPVRAMWDCSVRAWRARRGNRRSATLMKIRAVRRCPASRRGDFDRDFYATTCALFRAKLDGDRDDH